jgi:hypothetical protein
VLQKTQGRHRTVPFAGLFAEALWRLTLDRVTLTAGRRLVAPGIFGRG